MLTIYTHEPTQRKARQAWRYFQAKHPAGRREAKLFYGAKVDGYGPGWVWELGSLPEDMFHWKGGDSLVYSATASGIDAWTRRNL